jgi:hypothetical protein
VPSARDHSFGSQLDRIDDLSVTGAAADVAGQRLADLHRGGLGHTAEKVVSRHYQARGAEATLHRTRFDKSLLHRVQHLPLQQPFDRDNLSSFGLAAEHEARADELPVHIHGARSAFALLACVLRAGKLQPLAEHGQQALPFPDILGNAPGR